MNLISLKKNYYYFYEPTRSQEQQVVDILSRKKNGKYVWRISWDDGSKSWEPKENLVDEDGTELDLLKNIEEKHPYRSKLPASQENRTTKRSRKEKKKNDDCLYY